MSNSMDLWEELLDFSLMLDNEIETGQSSEARGGLEQCLTQIEEALTELGFSREIQEEYIGIFLRNKIIITSK